MVCRCSGLLLAFVLVLVASQPASAQHENVLDFLKVGDTAPDVEFQPLQGDQKVKLSSLTADGPAVLVVLRGWPGYQCPICFRQMGSLVSHADDFKRLGAKVVLVYPGPADGLPEHAKDFLKGTEPPEPFVMMIDPDYEFTNLYHLRWDEPRETSYPSTFVLDPNRVIKFRKTSFSHGDRSRADDVLAAVEMIPAAGTTSAQ